MNTILVVFLPLGGLVCGWFIRWLYAKSRLSVFEQKASSLKEIAVRDAESAKKDVLRKAQDEIQRERRGLEKELQVQRADLQRYDKRIQQKEDNLERKIIDLDGIKSDLKNQQNKIRIREKDLNDQERSRQDELERIAGLSAEEAKRILIQELENEAKTDAQILVNKIEQEARAVADKKARSILVTSIQRLATEVTTEITVTTVSLPNDEMKGRIIGKEGRNIRTLETLTGVDIIIDDTPEAVVISCFDPIRKVIAKFALERLIADGRIHPVRIEEIVQKIATEVSQIIYEEGEKVLLELGIHDMPPEGIRALGRLHFRTSYGQNVLAHSREVTIIAGMIASEVGADVRIARRGALLHDIGKGQETDAEGGHALIGGELVRRMGEDPRVVNAVMGHHDDEELTSLEGVIVQLSDAISAARPGARRESLDSYVKRLENLEKIALDFDGVEKVFAMQAGRELRIMVNQEKVSDVQAKSLAKDIVKKIEENLNFPGRIRVTIIRETRIIEYVR